MLYVAEDPPCPGMYPNAARANPLPASVAVKSGASSMLKFG